MTSVTIPTDKLNKVLLDVEILLKDVASLVNQDETAQKRLQEIKENPEHGLSEKELDNYLEKRGVDID